MSICGCTGRSSVFRQIICLRTDDDVYTQDVRSRTTRRPKTNRERVEESTLSLVPSAIELFARLSGLTAGCRLPQAGFQVDVFEAQRRVVQWLTFLLT
jgi:hypothetical protein